MADEATVQTGDTTQASVDTADTQTPSEAIVTEATPEVAAQAEPVVETPVEKGPLSGAEDSKVEGSPEAYEDFSLPEGVKLEEADMNAFKELAKEHNLSQTEAQKAFDYSKSIVEQMNTEAEASLKEWRDSELKVWNAQPDADKKLLLAKKATDKLGLTSYMEESGNEYDSKLLTMAAELGRFMSEATHVTGTDTAPADNNPYKNSPGFNGQKP